MPDLERCPAEPGPPPEHHGQDRRDLGEFPQWPLDPQSHDPQGDYPAWDYPVEFLNRVDELAMLRERLGSGRAEFLVVYGRRRVGKTELLAHLASEVRAFYFEATDTVAAQQLRDLTDELARTWGNELLAAQPLTRADGNMAAASARASGVGIRVNASTPGPGGSLRTGGAAPDSRDSRVSSQQRQVIAAGSVPAGPGR